MRNSNFGPPIAAAAPPCASATAWLRQTGGKAPDKPRLSLSCNEKQVLLGPGLEGFEAQDAVPTIAGDLLSETPRFSALEVQLAPCHTCRQRHLQLRLSMDPQFHERSAGYAPFRQ